MVVRKKEVGGGEEGDDVRGSSVVSDGRGVVMVGGAGGD